MTKPYQSKLIPYETEIAALRARRPPTPYARIAQILCEKYSLSVHRDTIHSFVLVRSHGRKVACFAPPVRAKSQGAESKPLSMPRSVEPHLYWPLATGDPQPKRKFNYTPSDRYNLTRLTPEQVAALEKQTEEEGD